MLISYVCKINTKTKKILSISSENIPNVGDVIRITNEKSGTEYFRVKLIERCIISGKHPIETEVIVHCNDFNPSGVL